MKSLFSPFTRALFYGPARLYESGVRLRALLYKNNLLKTHRLTAPVISVGNLTVGGTGKTPLVAFIAQYLQAEKHHVAILSRGYKRASTGRVEVSNEQSVLCGPREAGDEPFLLATTCPGVRVVVDSDRSAAGRWLEEQAQITAFILDDAYQHLRVARDLNLLLIDATEPLDKAAMVPFGRLREPLTGLRRADAIIVTRADQAFAKAALQALLNRYCRKNIPVFFAAHEMTGLRRLTGESTSSEKNPASILEQKPVAALSGIARPERFVMDLQRLGLTVVLRRDFRDHHRYTETEFGEVLRQAVAAGAEAIITTEKDAANLPAEALRSSTLPVYAAQIEFRCEDETGLKKLIRHAANRR